MGLGSKIKEYRTKAGLTQQKLADQLFVSAQAVSRWEIEDVEPSIDTIKRMCNIFDCSLEDLLGMEKKEPKEANQEVKEEVKPAVKEEAKEEVKPEVKEEVKPEVKEETKEEVKEEVKPEVKEEKKVAPIIQERVIVKQAKPVLAVCEKCNRPIYNSNEIHRVEEVTYIRKGKRQEKETKRVVLCESCNKKRVEKERREKELAERQRRHKIVKKRIHSIIWPLLIIIVGVLISIPSFQDGNTLNGVYTILGGLLIAIFVATYILHNTFLPDLWWDVTSWGLVKFPGLIFSFSLDGVIWLIGMKILFYILGLVLVLAAAVLATVIGMILSIFVYPVALYRNLTYQS